MTGSLTLKDQGNELYRNGDFLKSAAMYTKAIKEDPSSAVLYSNRSAALLKLNKVAKALADAEECVKLDPKWDKGYMRMALALESQQRLEEAVSCYQQALQAAENNPEYAAKVKILSKSINRSKQIAAKVAKAQSKRSPEEEAALSFAEAKLAYATELIKEQGSNFHPELHFLEGKNSSSGGSRTAAAGEPQESAVRAAHAFDAPEVLAQFVAEMRVKVEELGAKAVVLVAPKSAVCFPQRWIRDDWPFGAHDGVFVQLQASIKQAAADSSDNSSAADQDARAKGAAGSKSSTTVLRKVWFIRLRQSKPPLEPQEVSQDFELLPLLLK